MRFAPVLASILVAVPLAAASPCRAAETAPADNRPQILKDATANFTSGIATVAGIVGAKESVPVGSTAPAQRAITVTDVLFGDPEIRTLYVDDASIPAKEGDHVLVVYRGRDYGPRAIVLPDTPEYRQATAAEMAAWTTAWDNDFVDRPALLRASETLLRDFFKQLAAQLPDDPLLGTKSLDSLKINRSATDVYVRIISHAVGLPHTVPVPREDGLILWIGAGCGRAPWGDPRTLADPERLAAAPVTVEQFDQFAHAARTWNQQYTRQWDGTEPLALAIHASFGDPTQNSPLSGALSMAFAGAELQAHALNADPPRDLDAAITFLSAHRDALAPVQPAQAAPPGQLIAVRDNLGVDRRLAGALRALGGHHPGASGNPVPPRKFTPQQIQRLTPILIDLLTDRTCISNQIPVDGLAINCHHVAYLLLVQITGQKLPAPNNEEPAGGMRPEPVRINGPADPPPNPALEAKASAARLEAWKAWWRTQITK